MKKEILCLKKQVEYKFIKTSKIYNTGVYRAKTIPASHHLSTSQMHSFKANLIQLPSEREHLLSLIMILMG